MFRLHLRLSIPDHYTYPGFRDWAPTIPSSRLLGSLLPPSASLTQLLVAIYPPPSCNNQWRKNRGVQTVQWTGAPELMRAPSYNALTWVTKMSEMIHLHSAHTTFHSRGVLMLFDAYSAPRPPSWGRGPLPAPQNPIHALSPSGFGPRNWGPLTYCWTRAPHSLATLVVTTYWYKCARKVLMICCDRLGSHELSLLQSGRETRRRNMERWIHCVIRRTVMSPAALGIYSSYDVLLMLLSCRKKKNKKFYFAKQLHVTTKHAQHVIMAGCQKNAFAHQSWSPIAEHSRTQKKQKCAEKISPRRGA